MAPVALGGALTALAPAAFAEWALNLEPGVTPISQEIYDLHMLIMWICVIIGVFVFGAMFLSMYLHRKSRGAVAAKFHHSTFAEITWTVIPCIILVAMAYPATKALIMMEDTSESEVTVKVTAYQWLWRYDYVEDGVTIYSSLANSSRAALWEDPESVENYLLEVDNNIVLPVGKKIRLLVTADDVIHAWWVPAFGMKKDAIPGYVNEMWIKIDEGATGIYRGQCAELCGKDHGFMPIVVEARDQAGYEAWLAENKQARIEQTEMVARSWSKSELMERGKNVYNAACASCHQLDGEGVPDNFPAIKGSNVATGEMADHLRLVLEGRPGTSMRAFGSRLSDVELAAVVTYQRNAFGNTTGDLIQPSEIAAARNLKTGG